MPTHYTALLIIWSLFTISCEDQSPSVPAMLNDMRVDESLDATRDQSLTIDMGDPEDQAVSIASDMSSEEVVDARVQRMPSCIISCAEFVECAIKQCPGYDEADDSILMEECLSLCTPNIAELFDRVNGCTEKLRFASTVRNDFLNFCDSESDGFCETYVATCGEWLGETQCENHYNESPRSGAEPTSGAHQECYEFHLGRAMRALEDGDDTEVRNNCERSAGLNTCID